MHLHKHVLISVIMFVAVAALSLPSYGADAGETAATGASPIPVTLIMDETGSLAANGLPNELAAKLAVAYINSHGGVLGRQLKLTDLDSQSSQSKYVTLARKVADSDAAVVMGGILSASRAAIRPIFDRADKLYVYSQLYEGGVCDKDFFSNGVVPTQQLAPMLKYAVKKDLKKWFVMAANYNYGQISAQWVKFFAKKYGAQIVGGSPKFYALTHSNFSNVIPKIQASGAELIISLLVGSAESNFYKQWKSTGLSQTTKIMSPVYGSLGQQISLGGAGAGVLAAFPYMPTAHPSPKDKLAAAWKASGTNLPLVPNAAASWSAWFLWAAAVEKTGTLDQDKVIAALENGVSYDGPAGKVFFDGPTHQIVTPVRLWRDNGQGSFDLVKTLSTKAEPVFMQSKCNLIKHPDTNKQFTPQFSQ
jgi:branched-chain amino acid transport system substrate-binding protein